MQRKCDVMGKRGVNRTHDVVVLAAHGFGGARVATAHADDVDGRAGKANKDIDTLNDNAKQSEEEGGSGIASL